MIAFCAWRISGILGVNPFSKVKHPRFAPYEPDPEDDEDDRPDRESFGDDQSPFGRARRRRQEQARSWGRSEDFREYDPYDEALSLIHIYRTPQPTADHPDRGVRPGCVPVSAGELA